MNFGIKLIVAVASTVCSFSVFWQSHERSYVSQYNIAVKYTSMMTCAAILDHETTRWCNKPSQ